MNREIAEDVTVVQAALLQNGYPYSHRKIDFIEKSNVTGSNASHFSRRLVIIVIQANYRALLMIQTLLGNRRNCICMTFKRSIRLW